ncbi:hypothetical protein HYV70_00330 [Candidatus Uhrbacteria bacterium]|nr:hypothetical protein [Candidatus Uhrbacteria bacterium]
MMSMLKENTKHSFPFFEDAYGDWETDMEEQKHPQKNTLEIEKKLEGLEWVANPPLENTSFVYSVPIRGEWNNGQAARLLQGMLAQRIAPGQALEVNLFANISGLSSGIEIKDAGSLEKVRETGEVVQFIRDIVDVQRLAREANRARSRADKKIKKQELEQKIQSIPDPLSRELLRQSAVRAEQISIALVDAQKVEVPNIGHARTLGIDAVYARFQNNKNIVVSLFDADTVPLDNHTVQQLQALYATNPRLMYVFSSMSDQAKGTNRTVVSNTTMGRHISYNTTWGHGSPQISFRLHAYETLNRIKKFGIIGDEDRDTAVRLAYHFNDLQDGLLFESSQIANIDSSPRVLTADRIDGFVDGYGERHGGSPENILNNNIKDIWSWRKKLLEKIDQLPAQQKAITLRVLEQARETELHREKVQQRLNKTVVRSLLRAHEQGWVTMSDQGQKLVVNEEKVLGLPGGKALTHFLRMNRPLVLDVLQSPEDLQCLSYYTGLTKAFPEQIKTLSPLQHAFREYLGDVEDLGASPDLQVRHKETFDPNEYANVETVEDKRLIESKLSFWHGMTAELLAFAHVDRTLFQSAAFAEYQKQSSHWNPETKQEFHRQDRLGSDAEAAFAARIDEMTQRHGEQVRTQEKKAEEHSFVKFLSRFLPFAALLYRFKN